MVSSHFHYTEEYVLGHTFSWLGRKVRQAQREQFENHTTKVLGGYQSALLILDSVFNKGRDFNKILPPTLEDTIQSSEKKEQESKFVTGQWWKKS